MLIIDRNGKRFFKNAACCTALLLVSHALCAQASEGPRSTRDDTRRNSTTDVSDLAKDNFNRVAASAAQIREILVKDAGLLVELKHWIAKEATDNGQVVEDSKLLDEAIFDRLNRDVTFRAVATRLLQRYGYLMPSPNPDSSFGKEEDILLKERARRLVQIESQEDAESIQPKRNNNNQDVERTATCDPRQDENCDKQGTTDRRSNRPTSNEGPIPDENPGATPGDGSPSFSASPSRTLRTQLNQDEQELGQRDRMSSPQIELASVPPKSGSEPFRYQPNIPSVPNGLMVPRDTTSDADRSSTREAAPSQSTRTKRPRTQQNEEEDVNPVKMVHRASPLF